MTHDLLRDAPNQYVSETSQPMCRRNDQIDMVIFCKSADIQHRRAFRENRLIFYVSETYLAHELSHFAFGSFPGSPLQAGDIVNSSAFNRIDVSEIRGVQQNDLRPKFLREADRIPNTFPRATRKIYGDEDCLKSDPAPFFDSTPLSRVMRIGHGECCTILSAVLPRKTCFNPVRP